MKTGLTGLTGWGSRLFRILSILFILSTPCSLLASASEALNSTPLGLSAWLACLVFVVVLVNATLKLTDRLRGNPGHPPNEQLQNSHEQHERRLLSLEDWKARLVDKMDSDKEQILAAGSQRGKAIYDRIERVETQTNKNHQDILRAIGRLEGGRE